MTELESNGHIKKKTHTEIFYLSHIFSACSVLFVSSGVASLQKKNLVSEPVKDQVVGLKPIKHSSRFLGLFPNSLETFPEIVQGTLNPFTDSHSPSVGTHYLCAVSGVSKVIAPTWIKGWKVAILSRRPLYMEESETHLTVNLCCAAQIHQPHSLSRAWPQDNSASSLQQEPAGSSLLVPVIMPPAWPCLCPKGQQEVLLRTAFVNRVVFL